MHRLAVLLVASLVLPACAKKSPPPAHDHPASSGHAHTAPHGGTLVELGEHAYNIEFVRDTAAGKLTAYILDGHAENFVRIKAASFTIDGTIDGAPRSLLFQAVANPATGETIGDTSQFEAQADWLKSAGAFEAVIPSLEIRGAKFEDIVIRVQ